jgi:hypothetical protein
MAYEVDLDRLVEPDQASKDDELVVTQETD